MCLASVFFLCSFSARARHSSLEGQLSLFPESQGENLTWQKNVQIILNAQKHHLKAVSRRFKDQWDIAVNAISFNATQKQYHVDVTVAGWIDFTLLIHWPRPDQIQLGIANSWLPSDWILGTLWLQSDSAVQALKELGFDTQIELAHDKNNKDILVVDIQSTSRPQNLAGYFDQTGAFLFNLKPAHFPTETLNYNTQQGLSFDFFSELAGTENLKITLAHKGQINIGPKKAKHIKLKDKTLYDRIEHVQARIEGNASFTGNMEAGLWQGTFTTKLPLTRFKGHDYAGLKSYPVRWKLRWPFENVFDFEIQPELPPSATDASRLEKVHFHRGRLQYTITGPDFMKALMSAVRKARNSLQHEVYVFYADETTEKLARLYTLKAMGLREEKGELLPDRYAPEGITIQLMHNHTLAQRHAENITELYAREKKDILQQLKRSGRKPALYAERMAQNLQLRALDRGIVKTDHRKLIIVDHQIGFVGGFNIADHYLGERAFHDLMCQVEGPIVKDLEFAFDQNWRALKQQNPLKPIASHQTAHKTTHKPHTFDLKKLPQSHEKEKFHPQMALLLHDHDRANLLPAMLDMIRRAEHTLRIEQAYFDQPDIIRALKGAKSRGVSIEVVVSYHNGQKVFEKLNLINMLDLKRSEGPGNVEAWLYLGRDKSDPADPDSPAAMVHTKYISMDEKEAIVGSTNMIPRSLHSPFYGLLPEFYTHSPALFNEEIGIWIKGREAVSTLDYDLIKTDQKNSCILADEARLEDILKQRGGKWEQLLARVKSLLS